MNAGSVFGSAFSIEGSERPDLALVPWKTQPVRVHKAKRPAADGVAVRGLGGTTNSVRSVFYA